MQIPVATPRSQGVPKEHPRLYSAIIKLSWQVVPTGTISAGVIEVQIQFIAQILKRALWIHGVAQHRCAI